MSRPGVRTIGTGRSRDDRIGVMRIVRVTAWADHLPYVEGVYRMAGDRVTTGMDTTIVRVEADTGLAGIGESGTVGVTYDAAFPEGQHAALPRLAAAILGRDPRNPPAVARAMDAALTGNPYTKAALDMAVWDLAAQAADVPLWLLLGGDGPEPTPLYRPVQGPTPEAAAAKAIERLAQGYTRLQVKVGDDPWNDAARVLAVRDAVGPEVVIYADANCNFTRTNARHFVRALGPGGGGVILEQPCATLADCAALRDCWGGPMVMDENTVSLAALLEGYRLGVTDGITIKLTRVGGITPARQIRDVAVALGVAVTVEDAAGGDLVDMAFAHLNASTPARQRAHTVDFGGWVTKSNVTEAGRARVGSFLRPPAEQPGLGVTLDEATLPAPLLDVQAAPA
jgi:L-alanine-DL-glutamate epimerase-like enolase superfamily enzyme